MTPRLKFWLITSLVTAVIAAAIYIPILRKRMKRAARQQQQSEEQARRELIQPIPVNPSDPRVKTKFFWASDTDESALTPVIVELTLSNDPVLRSKQVLNTLLAGPVDAELRTLPPDAVLLALYILPDGTAIADFSEALTNSTPSGIVSEQLAVNSMARTLEANVPQVQRLKILIHGQEVETLAGHLDLTGSFVVNTKSAQTSPSPAPVAASVAAAAPLTLNAVPGTLAQPAAEP
ncbi:MAG TPA: GerMN domain-containing protein [Candidatus Acidoferrum sp.]|nr:GerMN domain-containing protein [Candidatus Acidoferrum sp.]